MNVPFIYAESRGYIREERKMYNVRGRQFCQEYIPRCSWDGEGERPLD